MNWLAFGIAAGGVVGAFLLVEGLRGLFRWLEKRGVEVEQGVYDALEAGVQATWDELVRDLKKKAEDGKLTKEEKADARTRAKALALDFAAGPAKDALMAMGPQLLDALVSLVVQRRKKDGAA